MDEYSEEELHQFCQGNGADGFLCMSDGERDEDKDRDGKSYTRYVIPNLSFPLVLCLCVCLTKALVESIIEVVPRFSFVLVKKRFHW